MLTRSILEHGAQVYAIEPSGPMRGEAERALGQSPNFVSLDASASATTLPDASVDAIACAQAFHWFNCEETRREWRRILRPAGSVALVWNFLDREHPASGAYHDIMWASGQQAREIIDLSLATARENVLFASGEGTRWEVRHEQRLDWTGFLRRTNSVSYLPRPGSPEHATLMAQVEALFAQHSHEGVITLSHRTVALHRRLDG
jgi:SAM-dependent methyltransferase